MRVRAPSAVVAIGASAGGIEALLELLPELPASLTAALLVVVHLPPRSESRLAGVLGRTATLPVVDATDGAPLRAGHVLVAPPDRHLLVERGRVRLGAGLPVNGYRPSIDATFASLARTYRGRAVGVVLSGALDDGAEGMRAIKAAGGATLVQAPAGARHEGMIRSAQRATEIDASLPVEELAGRLAQIAARPLSP